MLCEVQPPFPLLASLWLCWYVVCYGIFVFLFVAICSPLNISTDNGVNYIDLRKPNQPLMELGHKKAVSYVSFMGPNELVSA